MTWATVRAQVKHAAAGRHSEIISLNLQRALTLFLRREDSAALPVDNVEAAAIPQFITIQVNSLRTQLRGTAAHKCQSESKK